MELKGIVKELIPKMLNLPQDKLYELIEYKEKRGKDANAYFHVLSNKLARFYNLSDSQMKIKLNTEYGTIARKEDGSPIGAKYPKGTNPYDFYEYASWYKEEDNCDCYLFYKRTHLLNTKEMSQLINGVVQECKDVGIETLEDIKIRKLLEEWNK